MKLKYIRIDPAYDKRTFLRKAWISLANEDVPLDVFDADFMPVALKNHHCLSASGEYRAHWEADIGYNRVEKYVDFETYYDQEPYTDYEVKWNSDLKINERIPVTKYRRVEKQRQVTKEREVTDWHFCNGDKNGDAGTFYCVDEKPRFVSKRYFIDVEKADYIEFKDYELKQSPDMVITESMLAQADIRSRELAIEDVCCSLPGDEYRNFSCKMIYHSLDSATLKRIPEYSAKIIYKGKKYVKKAFAFGNMTMSLAKIPNPTSIDSEKKRLEEEVNIKIQREHRKYEDEARRKVLPLCIMSILLSALSIGVSLFFKYLIPVIACFAVSIAFFIFTKVFFKKVEEKATYAFLEKYNELEETYNDRIDAYTDIRKAEILNALNKKLVALGLEPLSKDEAGIDEGENTDE